MEIQQLNAGVGMPDTSNMSGRLTTGNWSSGSGRATIRMMKKQTAAAIVLLLLIPVLVMAGGWVFSQINPEIAAGHPSYARNYHYLDLAKLISFFAAGAVAGILWLLACFLVIRSKERSAWWLGLAALGTFGFAILAMLKDRAPLKNDRHERFVQNLNWFMRAGYGACVFACISAIAYEAMVLKRDLMVRCESLVTGVPTAQIIDQQNASSGMWAFAELNEVMYVMVLLYLIWPAVFNGVCRRMFGDSGRIPLAQTPKAR